MTKRLSMWAVVVVASACGGKIEGETERRDGPVARECGESSLCVKEPQGPLPSIANPTPGEPTPTKPPTTKPTSTPPSPPAPTTPPSTPADKPVLEGGWEAHAFTDDASVSECHGGERYSQYSPRYDKWVGVELCTATKYKIYLGESHDSVFHEIADWSGGGQDHCELVNPAFTLLIEDDITSGGCNDCAYGYAYPFERPDAVSVYTRGQFRAPFELEPWPEHNHYTGRWYSCGVAIP